VSPYTPLLGAEIVLDARTGLSLDVDDGFEHGILVDAGLLGVGEAEAKPGDLAYVPPGSNRLELRSYDEPVRLLLLGGPPFGEPIVMWWNFVGRSHEEIVRFREEWQAQIVADGGTVVDPHEAGGLREPTGSTEQVVADTQDSRDGRFGIVVGDHLAPIPAPELPNAQLKERR
jgi:quercetin 2,3-dioxygenase